MLRKILIATNNSHKREKLSWIVRDYFKTINFPENLKTKVRVDENGNSFKKNAEIKALTYSKYYDGYVIATDGGVLIPSLGKNWNPLKTKRFAGEEISDFKRIRLLLDFMKDKKGKDRITTWNEAVAVAKKGKILFSSQAEGVKGVLQTTFDEKKYKPGIWVCSIWYFPRFKKNFFDLSESEIKEVEISWSKLKSVTNAFLDKILNQYEKRKD